jgi:serine/threonine-protein phosphatase 2A regulatory subunit B'
MVYNAMKLFMEVNPQLFDDCSHDYTEQQNNADQVKKARQEKWDRLASLAQSMKSGLPSTSTAARPDDTDPLRLEQLRLQDDSDRRPKEFERQASSVR